MTPGWRRTMLATAWFLFFTLFGCYAALRMQVFELTAPVALPEGVTWLPNTYATVDHPFHVARAATLWRELGEGHFLRWFGQHQGGYPVEFYPLGEAWLEVSVRALSLGNLAAEGAHTLAVFILFLLPGVGFLALARLDGQSPAVGVLALALQLALPGGWYHGGYTELVQWGLVTNVAGATAAFLLLPALTWFCRSNRGPALALSVFLATAAVYSNPRSLIGVAAVALGCLAALCLPGSTLSRFAVISRITLVTVLTAFLAAPQLFALVRFGGLYTFVHYSGYVDLDDFLHTSLASVTPWVIGLAACGSIGALVRRRGKPGSPPPVATRGGVLTLVIYMLMTVALSFVQALAALASQLETTRLMPLQRFLTLYLAASGAWWLLSLAPRRFSRAGEMAMALASVVLVAVLTRPPEQPIDPASPVVPGVGLYPVTMSAQPVQAQLREAIERVDSAAAPGTALLVLGSGLSWHQALWAPLWTERPLFYDNWLWYWHPDQFGTPGYRAARGNDYPDPDNTLTTDYLAAHGIGGVAVTGRAADAAAQSPLMQSLGGEGYQAYLVREPSTTITFGGANAAKSTLANEAMSAEANVPSATVQVRANWFPRWQATGGKSMLSIARANDGSISLEAPAPVSSMALTYGLQPIDWLARALAVAGLVLTLVHPLRASRFARRGYHVASRERSAAS